MPAWRISPLSASDNNEAAFESLTVSANSILCQTCGDVVFENENTDEGYLAGTTYLPRLEDNLQHQRH